MADEKPKYIDDLTVRETYAETVQVVIDSAGMLRIEFGVFRWPAEAAMRPPDRMVPVARIALHPGLAEIMIGQLQRTLAGIQKAREGAILPEPHSQN